MDPTLRFRFDNISPSVLVDFFEAIGVTFSCPQCSSERFHSPTIDIMTSFVANDPRAGNKGAMMRTALVPHEMLCAVANMSNKLYVYPMTCQTCGTMQSINARTVLDWHESHQSGGV